MLKHVLVPLDGSNLAAAALDVAKSIVEPDCQITLVTAVQIPVVPIYAVEPMAIVDPTGTATVEDIYREMKTYLDRIAADVEGGLFQCDGADQRYPAACGVRRRRGVRRYLRPLRGRGREVFVVGSGPQR